MKTEEITVERKPLLADGSIVGSYEPLYSYWELAKGRGIEEAAITREDIEFIREIVESAGRLRILEVREKLVKRFILRVNPEVAEEAYKRLGFNFTRQEAQRGIAEILAGWSLEAARNLNLISLRGWPTSP